MTKEVRTSEEYYINVENKRAELLKVKNYSGWNFNPKMALRLYVTIANVTDSA